MTLVQHQQDYFSRMTQWINRMFCIPIRDTSCSSIQESAGDQLESNDEVIVIVKNATQHDSMPLHKYASLARENNLNEKN